MVDKLALILPKLAPLLKMIFDSGAAIGEVANAASIARQKLKAGGCDVHDLVKHIENPNATSSPSQREIDQAHRLGYDEALKSVRLGVLTSCGYHFEPVPRDGGRGGGMNGYTWSQIAKHCAAHPDRLKNDFEIKFCKDLAKWRGPLSPKQQDVLRRIFENRFQRRDVMNYHNASRDQDEAFFRQHPERNYYIRHMEIDEIDARLGDLWDEEALPPGKRYFAVVRRGRHNEMGAMFHVDDVDAPVDLDEEACRAIFAAKFPEMVADAGALCLDCGVDTIPHGEPGEFYGVWDDIWAAAGMSERTCAADPVEFLCIGCLETRLGRTLIARDFIDGSISWVDDSNTPRLNDRMTREPEKKNTDQVTAARLIARLKECYAALVTNAAQVAAGTASLRTVLAYDSQTMRAMLGDMDKLAALDRKTVLRCWSETGAPEQ